MTFIGLQKVFCTRTGMHLSPQMVTAHTTPDDPEVCWSIKSVPPHHTGWCQPAQLYGTVAGLLTRCSTLSTTDTTGLSAAAWGLYVLHHCSGVPWPRLQLLCRRWSKQPQNTQFAALHALSQAAARPPSLLTA